MCYYWKTILDFQILVLVYIRSIREGNFQVYIESFISIAKWYFSLDRYNYARWGTVHCFDLMLLQRNCLDIYEQFRLGNISFLKTCSEFSRIALDQVHEQNNKVIKGSGGSTHLFFLLLLYGFFLLENKLQSHGLTEKLSQIHGNS